MHGTVTNSLHSTTAYFPFPTITDKKLTFMAEANWNGIGDHEVISNGSVVKIPFIIHSTTTTTTATKIDRFS